MPGFLRVQADGILLSVKLQPRASANEIGEALGNELRIKVTAPPVDAAANDSSPGNWTAPATASSWCAATPRATRSSSSTASPRKKWSSGWARRSRV
ncbi:MAG: DUF167 family protein [Verrucomicrobia bacterium]|nr:DUF167 family protein [Verrucomicrobiota bacterium]